MPDELTARILNAQASAGHPRASAEPRLVSEEDAEARKRRCLRRLLPVHRNPKVVFAYSGERAQNNWLGAHEQGRLAMQAELGEKVDSRVLDLPDREEAYDLLRQERGTRAFVSSPPRPDEPVLRVCARTPSCQTLSTPACSTTTGCITISGGITRRCFLCGIARASTRNRRRRLRHPEA
jgi:hypothetical protein